jgi:hypothetical protein
METPGRTVSGWWDSHNNALYLERLVHPSTADENAGDRKDASAKPAFSLLWRPISFPKSAAAKARAARADDVPQPRKGGSQMTEGDAAVQTSPREI